jgi:histone-lysine N-methyltransferase SETD3
VRAELLQGSPVLAEARQRQAALQEQWAALAALPAFSSNPEAFPPSVFNEPAFLRSFCVVLACAAYLPSAECFALVPVASCMSRSGNDNGCNLDYDPESSTVKVITTRPYRCEGCWCGVLACRVRAPQAAADP